MSPQQWQVLSPSAGSRARKSILEVTGSRWKSGKRTTKHSWFGYLVTWSVMCATILVTQECIEMLESDSALKVPILEVSRCKSTMVVTCSTVATMFNRLI